jgi:hypothetical protein
MKKSIFLLGIVAGMFLVAGGCNDAIDNDVFEAVDNGAPVAPAARAPEEEVEVSLRSSDLRVSYVNVYGATGLWTTFTVTVNYTTPDGETGSIVKTGGRLWHTTSVNLSDLPQGSDFYVHVQDECYKVSAPDTYTQTPNYTYTPKGDILDIEVWGGFWVAFKGRWHYVEL